MPKQFHNPEPFKSAGRPYAAIVRAGEMVFLAGQLGVEFINGQRTVVTPGKVEGQTAQIFRNMRSLLSDLGGTLDDICWIQIFVTDMADRLPMDAVRRQFFREGNEPAATLIQVSGLALPGAVVEINALAVIETAARKAAAE